MVAEPDLSGPEWLQVVPSAQLMVQDLQLLLDLGVVASRTWVQLLLLGNLIEEVPLDWRVERAGHALLVADQARVLLDEQVLLLLHPLIHMVLVWRWTVGAGGVLKRHCDHVSL